MANAYTSTASTSLGGSTGSAGLVQKAYDRLVEFALRTQPMIRSISDKRPANLTNPGSSVTFQLYNDLSRVTSNLTETVDPDAVALATPKSVSVTLNEYGNAVLVTRALNLFSLADVDPAIANIIAYNMADSVDELAQTALLTGTNVVYGAPASTGTRKTSTNALTATDNLRAADIRLAVAKLRANNAVARKGSMFWAGIHPEVAHDLRAETGMAAWRDPHAYQSNDNIWAGEIGSFEGAYFIESPRMRSDYQGATIATIATKAISAYTTSSITFTTTLGADVQVGNVIYGTNTAGGATSPGAGSSADAYARIKSIDSSRTYITLDTNNTGVVSGNIGIMSTAKTYRTYIAGQQALAEAVAEEPHVVIGPVVDKLMRHRPMGWYGVLGFNVFRNESLYRIETGSSIS